MFGASGRTVIGFDAWSSLWTLSCFGFTEERSRLYSATRGGFKETEILADVSCFVFTRTFFHGGSFLALRQARCLPKLAHLVT